MLVASAARGGRAGADGGEVENGERHHDRGNADAPPRSSRVRAVHRAASSVRRTACGGVPTGSAEWARGHNGVMALADTLHGLLRLPGATYACVVERDSGRVLAEAGRGEGGAGDGEGVVPYSVARWGTAVAAMFDATSGDELDDVMITGRRSYHLVRSLGASASVLAYLRLDRTRSNLAVARRELAAVRWGAAAAPARACPRRRSRAAPPAVASRASRRRGTPRPSRGASDPRPAGAVPRPAPVPRSPRAPVGPRAPATPHSGGRPRRRRPRPGRGAPGGGARTAGPRTVTRMPASLPPTGTPARGLRSVDGPAGPRAARPDAPRPARRRDAEPVDAPRIPLPRRAPTHSPTETPGAARRRARRVAPSRRRRCPEGFAMPAVLGQSWAQDPGTLRRLIAGLRRMS